MAKITRNIWYCIECGEWAEDSVMHNIDAIMKFHSSNNKGHQTFNQTQVPIKLLEAARKDE